MSVLDPAPLRLKGKFDALFFTDEVDVVARVFEVLEQEQIDFRRAIPIPTFDRGEGRRQGGRPVPCSL